MFPCSISPNCCQSIDFGRLFAIGQPETIWIPPIGLEFCWHFMIDKLEVKGTTPNSGLSGKQAVLSARCLRVGGLDLNAVAHGLTISACSYCYFKQCLRAQGEVSLVSHDDFQAIAWCGLVVNL